VQNFARRRPGVFLLGCATAGFVTGRLLRGGAASSGGSNGGTTAADPSDPQASPAPSPYAPAPAD
jgi:hypothetical protein